ncbi:TPA: hypothetical protein ACGU7E_004281 [Vibrio vulnificus]|uniref:hypothetical protein n=1 Tax=Vibrio vulnificus TaxID=672 RepID=UPI0009321875|nr:hypothetical protein CRN33_20545 [Vibrio vulnificus]
MKVQIQLTSGVHPRFLMSTERGFVETTSKQSEAIRFTQAQANQVLESIKPKWPLAQLSYELGA